MSITPATPALAADPFGDQEGECAVMDSVMPNVVSARFVSALADAPGAASTLQREHTRPPEGRCRVCTAGPQAGHVLHPCRLHTLATAALVEIARRRAEG